MKPTDLLHRHHLRSTSCREDIIELMNNTGEALSESEIRERIGNRYDRTTFYRSFRTLREKKIIHKVVVDKQLVKYATENNSSGSEEHAHFVCLTCHSVRCIELPGIENITLPEGFQLSETELVLKGTCPKCNA